MKCLVTGGAGFIGSHLVDRLVSANHDVTVIDNLSTGQASNIAGHDAKLHLVDIRDGKALEKVFNESTPEIVFHLAAQINLRNSINDPINDAMINVIGSLNVIQESIKYNSKIIFASTGGAIYDSTEKLPWHSDFSKVGPNSPYGIAKLSVENYLRALAPESVSMRLANVYGPRQNPKGEAGVVAIFIDNILNKKELNIFGNGLQTRDFVYIDDVINAFMMVMDKNISGIYNVGTSQPSSIIDVMNIIKSIVELDEFTVVYKKAIPGELLHSVLGYHKLYCVGWEPEVSLPEGIEKTIKYYM